MKQQVADHEIMRRKTPRTANVIPGHHMVSYSPTNYLVLAMLVSVYLSIRNCKGQPTIYRLLDHASERSGQSLQYAQGAYLAVGFHCDQSELVSINPNKGDSICGLAALTVAMPSKRSAIVLLGSAV